MTRVTVNATIDEGLLAAARRIRPGIDDGRLIDEGLGALPCGFSQNDVDAAYAAYESHPLDEPDAWGDLASFRDAAAQS